RACRRFVTTRGRAPAASARPFQTPAAGRAGGRTQPASPGKSSLLPTVGTESDIRFAKDPAFRNAPAEEALTLRRPRTETAARCRCRLEEVSSCERTFLH